MEKDKRPQPFSSLCQFIQPPPTKEELEELAKSQEVKLDSSEGPIKRGSQKQ